MQSIVDEEFNRDYKKWKKSPYYNKWTDNKIVAEPYMEGLGIYEFRKVKNKSNARKYRFLKFSMKGFGHRDMFFNREYGFGRIVVNDKCNNYIHGLLAVQIDQNHCWLIHFER